MLTSALCVCVYIHTNKQTNIRLRTAVHRCWHIHTHTYTYTHTYIRLRTGEMGTDIGGEDGFFSRFFVLRPKAARYVCMYICVCIYIHI